MPYQDLYSDTYELDQRFKPFPTLPTVVWAIDGHEVLVDNDWVCDADDDGGFKEALIRVYDADRLPRGIMRGMSLTATERESGWVVWDGSVDGEPHRRGLLAEVRGVGNKWLLQQQKTPRNYMTRDPRVMQDAHDLPFDFATTDDTEEIEAELVPAGTGYRFGVEKNETQASGARHLLAAWTPGTDIHGYAFDYWKLWNNGSHDIRTYPFTGPQGAAGTAIDLNMGGAPAVKTWHPESQSFASPANAMALGFRVNTGDTWAQKQIVRIKNFRLYGISSDDVMSPRDVVVDLGTNAGLDISRVSDSFSVWEGGELLTNFLPFYPRGAWSDSTGYIADLCDAYWGVYEKSFAGTPMLEFGPWSDNSWEVSTEFGCVLEHCDPLRPFSGILVKYPNLAGEELFYELVFTPNPNEDIGESPMAEFVVVDLQADSGIAQNVASTNEEFCKREAWDISGLITHCTQNGVPTSPYRVRPTGEITVADCHPHGAATERIQSTRYSAVGTEFGCNRSTNVAEELLQWAGAHDPDVPPHGRSGRGHKRRRRRRRPRL